MGNVNSLDEDNQIAHYLNQALMMMQVYESEEKEEFYMWLNRFEYVADILSVPEDKMVDFFNRMVDYAVHKRVWLHNLNVNVSELSYVKRINYYLQILYNLNKINRHRKRFKHRYQYEQETIKKYADNLRKMYNKCCYSYRDEVILCEQFIKGIRYIEIRKYFSKPLRLSFDETVAKAIEFVTVDKYLNQAVLMIHTYSLNIEDKFCKWLNKFEYVADMIGVPDNKMVEFFNKMVENDVHKCVMETNPHINFSEFSYKQIIYYYFHKFYGFMEYDLYQIRLFDRKQYEQEMIEKYADSLRNLYNMCSDHNYVEEKLCEQFIKGCLNNELRKYLRQIPRLSFDETVAKAIEFIKVFEITHYVDHVLSMINTYTPNKEGLFYEWLNKFEYVADIVGVPDDKMVELFNKMVDNDVHKCVMETILSCTYVNFSELSYDEIIDHYYNYFVNFNEINIQRKRFKCRYQYEEETLQQYADNLRKIYENCCYKCRFQKRLCKQFINGIRDDEIRIHLNKFPKLSFNEIVTKAIYKLEKIKEINY